MNSLAALSKEWIALKGQEDGAKERRRLVEDKILSLIGFAENQEGQEIHPLDEGFVIKITGRLNHKTDVKKLQELAAEEGSSEHLHALFKWGAEIIPKKWKSTSKEITRPLLGAISTSAGRPSVSITEKEVEE